MTPAADTTPNTPFEQRDPVYDNLCKALQPDLEELREFLLEEARDRGRHHVNAMCGTGMKYHPTKVLLQLLVERLQEEIGY